jgi:hypothetical protein
VVGWVWKRHDTQGTKHCHVGQLRKKGGNAMEFRRDARVVGLLCGIPKRLQRRGEGVQRHREGISAHIKHPNSAQWGWGYYGCHSTSWKMILLPFQRVISFSGLMHLSWIFQSTSDKSHK